MRRYFFLLGICMLPALVHAQLGQLLKLTPDSTQSVPTIAVSDIILESTRDIETLHKIQHTMHNSLAWQMLQQKVDTLFAEIESIHQDKRNVEIEALNRVQLEPLKRRWKMVQLKIRKQFKQFADQVNAETAQLEKIASIRTVWMHTREKLKSTQTLPILRQRVDHVIDMADTTAAAVNHQLAEVVAKQDQLARYSLEIDDIVSHIAIAYQQQAHEMFVRESPPIWRVDNKAPDFVTQLAALIHGDLASMNSFISDYTTGIIIHIFIFITLLSLNYFMYHKIIDNRLVDTEGGNFQIVLSIFRKPFIVTIVIVAFASFFLYRAAPQLLSEFLVLIALGFMIPLVPIIFSKKASKLILLTIPAFFFIRILGLVSIQTLDLRLALLFLSLYGIFMATRALRPEGLLKDISTHTRQVVWQVFGYTLLVLFSLSVLANLVGAVYLSYTTINGLIRGVIAGLMYYVYYVIITGVVDMALRSKSMQGFTLIKRNSSIIKRDVQRVSTIIFVVLWLFVILDNYHVLQQVWDGVTSFFTTTRNIGEASFTLGNIILFIVIVWLSFVVGNILKVVLADGVLTYFNLARGLPATIAIMTRYAIITIGFMLAVSSVGLSMDRLTVLLGALGVGIGFGLQNIANNLISGFILLFERPIQLNDIVQVGGVTGTVKSIGIRSSNIKTFDGAEVIVPNGDLISKEVINWTLSDQHRRVELIIGVAYGSEVYRVKDILAGLLKSHQEVLALPAPQVLFHNLGESSLDFRLLFWADVEQRLRIQSEMIFAIHDALNKAGIAIPFPQRDVYIKNLNAAPSENPATKNE